MFKDILRVSIYFSPLLYETILSVLEQIKFNISELAYSLHYKLMYMDPPYSLLAWMDHAIIF